MNRSKKNPSSSSIVGSKSNSSNKSSSSSSASTKKAAPVKRPTKRTDADDMEEGIYELSHIIGKFIEDDGSIFYKVAWVGFPKPTIEPADNLASASRLVDEFERKLAESQARKKALAAAAAASQQQAQQLADKEQSEKEQTEVDDPFPPAASTVQHFANPTDATENLREPDSQIARESPASEKEAQLETTSKKETALSAPLAPSPNDAEVASSSPSASPSTSHSASSASASPPPSSDADIMATNEAASTAATAKGSRARKKQQQMSEALIVSGKRSRRKTDDLSPLRPDEERALRQEEKLNKLLHPNKQQRTDTNKKPRSSNGDGDENEDDDEEDEQEWQMRKIVGTRKDEDGTVYYKVDWMPSETGKEYEPTWEPRVNILDDSLILEFNERIKKGRKIRPNGVASSQSPASQNAVAGTMSPSGTASVEAPTESTEGVIEQNEEASDAIMKHAEEDKEAPSESRNTSESKDSSKAPVDQPADQPPVSDSMSKSLSAPVQPVDMVIHHEEAESNSPEVTDELKQPGSNSPEVTDELKQPRPSSPVGIVKTLRQMVGLD